MTCKDVSLKPGGSCWLGGKVITEGAFLETAYRKAFREATLVISLPSRKRLMIQGCLLSTR